MRAAVPPAAQPVSPECCSATLNNKTPANCGRFVGESKRNRVSLQVPDNAVIRCAYNRSRIAHGDFQQPRAQRLFSSISSPFSCHQASLCRRSQRSSGLRIRCPTGHQAGCMALWACVRRRVFSSARLRRRRPARGQGRMQPLVLVRQPERVPMWPVRLPRRQMQQVSRQVRQRQQELSSLPGQQQVRALALPVWLLAQPLCLAPKPARSGLPATPARGCECVSSAPPNLRTYCERTKNNEVQTA